MHNFEVNRNHYLPGVDNDICTKCYHSRIYCREPAGDNCPGDKSVGSIEDLQKNLEHELQIADMEMRNLFEAYGRLIFKNNGLIEYPTFCHKVEQDTFYELTEKARVAEKNIERITGLIEAIQKYA